LVISAVKEGQSAEKKRDQVATKLKEVIMSRGGAVSTLRGTGVREKPWSCRRGGRLDKDFDRGPWRFKSDLVLV